jgi:DNA-binding MarR family transcriptional regulator
MRRKHHLRVKRMGRTPSLTGLELSILLYLHGDFERSDEEIMAECRGIEQESVRHAVRGLAGREFIIRTKEEEFLLRPDCWLITYAGRQALRQWVSAAAPARRSSRTRVTA